MKEPGGIELIDRSVFLARTVLLQHLWIYYAATIPVVLCFLWFFNDMSAGISGGEHVVFLSILLTFFIVIMKTGQAVFSLRSYETLIGSDKRKVELAELFYCTVWQILFAFAEILLLPLAILLTVPFGWCYAYFQIGSMGPLLFGKDFRAETAKHAKIWPKQNHVLLWILCPVSLLVMVICYLVVPPILSFFGHDSMVQGIFIVLLILLLLITIVINPAGWLLFGNFLILLIIAPFFLRTVFGIETLSSMNIKGMFHPGVILMTWSICFIFLDPLIKIAYLLRIYDLKARSSGHDLILRAGKLLLVFIASMYLLVPQNLFAQAKAPDPNNIDNAISEVLKNPQYSWRGAKTLELPHFKIIENQHVSTITKDIKAFFKNARNWFVKFFKTGEKKNSDNTHFLNGLISLSVNPILLMSLLIGILVLMFILLRIKALRQIKAKASALVISAPDAVEEQALKTISAEDNTPDEWESRALQSLDSGDFKNAIRYLYLSTLSLLSEKRIIHIKKSWSNREIKRDLFRKYPDKQSLNQNFSIIVNKFEYTWFGVMDVTSMEVDTVRNSHKFIREFAGNNA